MNVQKRDRYKLALLLLTLAVVPLFYISSWLGTLAAAAIYYLTARLANMDLERQRRRSFSAAGFAR